MVGGARGTLCTKELPFPLGIVVSIGKKGEGKIKPFSCSRALSLVGPELMG